MDQRHVEEPTQVLYDLGAPSLRDGASCLLQRILGQFAVPRATDGVPEHLGVGSYSREIFTEIHCSSSGQSSGRCRTARSVDGFCLISLFHSSSSSGSSQLRDDFASLGASRCITAADRVAFSH